MREKWPTVVFAAVACIALVTYLVVFQVRINQVAVHERLGGVERVINEGNQNEAGWYFKAPWPIDRVTKHDKRVHVLDSRLSQTQLQDDWNVIVSTFAGWRITDPVQFRRTLRGDAETAENYLEDDIFKATSEVLSSTTIDNLVSTDEEQLQYDATEQKIADRVKDVIRENKYGVELSSFGIRRVALPENTTGEVLARMRAERNKHATDYKAEGQSRKAELTQEAESKKQKMIADARAKAKSIMAEGEAEAAQYYDTFARAPEFSIFLRQLESLDKIAAQAKENNQPITFVLDTSTEPFGLLEQGPLQESDTMEPDGDKASDNGNKETDAK